MNLNNLQRLRSNNSSNLNQSIKNIPSGSNNENHKMNQASIRIE